MIKLPPARAGERFILKLNPIGEYRTRSRTKRSSSTLPVLAR